jgi:hypothetical protein
MSTWTPSQQLWAVLSILVVMLLWTKHTGVFTWPLLAGVDNHVYWSAWHDGRLYDEGARLATATYIYSPAFAQLIYPFTLLPWDVFRILWIAASWAAMLYLLAPLRGVLRIVAIIVAFYFCLNASAEWIVALSLGLGLRFPATWAALFLTKVTPGVGIVWFAVRREWRSLAIAMGSTAAIVFVSFVAAPGLWFDWVATLLRSVPHTEYGSFLGLPTPSLLVRLPIAFALVVLGAWRGWPWVLPAAALLAQPDPWGPTILVFASLPRLYEQAIAPVRLFAPRSDSGDAPDSGFEMGDGSLSGTPAGVP